MWYDDAVKRKLRIAFIIVSAIGWVMTFASLRMNGAWVLWTIGLPVAIGFGIAAFALKPAARTPSAGPRQGG